MPLPRRRSRSIDAFGGSAVASPLRRASRMIRTRRSLGFLAAVVGATAALVALTAAPTLASHVACGDVVTQDTRLDSDLIDCPGDGIVVGARDITLDLNGHVVDGVGNFSSFGILNGRDFVDQGFDGVVVEDGTVREFGVGIDLRYVGDNRVRRTALVANRLGLVLTGFDDGNLIEHNVAQDNGGGIELSDSFGRTLISKNTALDNGWGIRLLEAGNTRVENNRALRNRLGGIGVDEGTASPNLVEHNVANDNGGDGIDVGEENVVARNTANRNADLGIDAEVGVIDGGGNRARDNGNPLQCLNVSCKTN
jgi:parallel beta-helix repeat protein